MTDRILMFVDALPFHERERMASWVPCLTWMRPIRPGFGYSINVKAELFAGLDPDGAGFLNEWSYAPGEGVSRLGFPRWLDRMVSSTWLGSRVFRRGLAKVLGENTRNIPLPLLSDLCRTGVNAYERTFPYPSLFTELDVERFLYTEQGGDSGAFDALMERMRTSQEPVHAFLATADLDHVLHVHAVGSEPYEKEIRVVADRLNQIWEVLVERGRGGQLCLVSDHGMASVHSEVEFELAGHFSGAGRRYGYFVDSTMARIWSQDDELLGEMAEFAREKELPGHFLSDDERADWGIRASKFGDLIFLLDEGFLFVPSFMGDSKVEGMHGYSPALASQEGLLAASTAMLETNGPVPAAQAYQGFRSFFA